MNKNMQDQKIDNIFLMKKENLKRINGGGLVADKFWYAVGYWIGEQMRKSNLPTGKLHPHY